VIVNKSGETFFHACQDASDFVEDIVFAYSYSLVNIVPNLSDHH